MKKVPFLRILTAVGSALSAVALLDLSGVANVVSPGLAGYMLAAGPIALASRPASRSGSNSSLAATLKPSVSRTANSPE